MIEKVEKVLKDAEMALSQLTKSKDVYIKDAEKNAHEIFQEIWELREDLKLSTVSYSQVEGDKETVQEFRKSVEEIEKKRIESAELSGSCQDFVETSFVKLDKHLSKVNEELFMDYYEDYLYLSSLLPILILAGDFVQAVELAIDMEQQCFEYFQPEEEEEGE